jgi:hypothetical protein
MLKRTAAASTVLAFVVFSTSCTMWGTREIQTTADYPRQDKQVLSVVKTSGDVVEFSKADPGRVRGRFIVGTARVMAKAGVEIEGPFPLIKKDSDGKISEVTDAKGRTYLVRTVLKEEPNKLTVEVEYPAVQPVSIPLSEARLVRFKRANTILTLMAIAAGGAVGLTALMLYALSRE